MIKATGMRCFLVLAAAVFLGGCSVVGKGTRTLIKHRCTLPGADPAATRSCQYLRATAPLYVTGASGPDRVLSMPPRDRYRMASPRHKQQRWQAFNEYLAKYYGAPAYEPLELGFQSRDRTRTPPLLQNDFRTLFLSALLRDKPISPGSIQALRTRIATMSDLVAPTAHHHTEQFAPLANAAVRVYYYYPRLSFDFSAALRGAVPPDRLDSLHLFVRLQTAGLHPRDPIRFLDFSPKEADIVDFARGQLTTTAQAQLAAGVTSAESSSLVTADSAAGTTRTDAVADTLGKGPLTLTASESMVTSLVDAIERRSAGILDGGRTFFASLRGLRSVKLAGTYNYDVELEVPSSLVQQGVYVRSVPALPPSGELKADIYMIGVVRHVARRGRAGLMTRVPENENDDTYDQVVVRVLSDQVLWRHTSDDDDWVDAVVQKSVCKLAVVTNEERATFVVRRQGSGEILASGRGTSKEFELSPDPVPPTSTDCSIVVDFLKIVDLTDGSVNELEAPDASKVIALGKTARVSGEYVD